MHKKIGSLHNPEIKKLLQLQQKSRLRKKEGVFVVEGIRELNLVIKGGYTLQKIYFCPEISSSEDTLAFVEEILGVIEKIEVSKEIYQKIAYRGSSEGLIGIVRAQELGLNKLKFKNADPLILVAEAPEKPGNIGALLRTADAANLDAVIIANPKTDIFNPNIIRSSVGCIFTNQIALGETPEIIAFLKDKNITIFGAALENAQPYHAVNFKPGAAIVVGTEATGLSENWLKNTSQNIKIPMQGKIDSINVSVAAGILIFEAKRQRMADD